MKKKRQKSNKQNKKYKRKQSNKLKSKSQHIEATASVLPNNKQDLIVNKAIRINGNFNVNALDYKFAFNTSKSTPTSSAYSNQNFCYRFNENFTRFFSLYKRSRDLDDKSKYLYEFNQKILKFIEFVKFKNVNLFEFTRFVVDNFNQSSVIHIEINKLFQNKIPVLMNSNNEIIESSSINDNNQEFKRSRPSYIIERDCHVFGGCVDDDAEDEFFIR